MENSSDVTNKVRIFSMIWKRETRKGRYYLKGYGGVQDFEDEERGIKGREKK